MVFALHGDGDERPTVSQVQTSDMFEREKSKQVMSSRVRKKLDVVGLQTAFHAGMPSIGLEYVRTGKHYALVPIPCAGAL